jgi:outer membrane protein assembly factor BamB
MVIGSREQGVGRPLSPALSPRSAGRGRSNRAGSFAAEVSAGAKAMADRMEGRASEGNLRWKALKGARNMKIKVQCPCGSRFEFEVEPVDGRMPVAIQCPNCGADATELANAVILEQSSPGLPGGRAKVSLKVSGGECGQPVPIPAPGGIPEEAGAAPAVEFCPKHLREPAIDTCRVCGKPICLKCMELFGYICSVFCRNQALERGLRIPVCPQQKSVLVEKEFQALKRGLAAAAAVVVLAAGFWIWYAWFGVMPKVVYSVKIPETAAADDLFELTSPGRLLSIAGAQLSVYDLRAGRPAWSATLEAPVWKGPGSGHDVGAVVASNKVYVLAGPRLSWFDLETGKREEAGKWKAPITAFSHDYQSIVIVSGLPGGPEVVTRVALGSGMVETEDAPVPASAEKQGAAPKPGYRAPALSEPAGGAKPGQPEVARNEFKAAGLNVVELRLKLLEAKVVEIITMKPKGNSVLESSSLNASQGSEVAAEMMSDAQRERGGGKRAEDDSRYQVALHRWFATKAPDWTGEVTGAPELFSLKTVDLLVSGVLLQVFDKNNKKLWESKLTYRIRDRSGAGGVRLPPPCLEAGNTLYLADKGMLTSFDLASGNVHWRLTTVGISRFQLDDEGKLYIDTTTSDPEFIQYPDDPALRKKAQPLVMKVEPATGTILWRSERTASNCLLSGKFVYAARISRASVLLHMGEGEKFDFNLYRLDPANGRELWQYYQLKRGVAAEARKNWILLQFSDEVQVLSFFSF